MSALNHTPEVAAFLAVLKESPGDMTTLGVCIDWLEDNGESAETVAELRDARERCGRAWREWEPFAKRLKELESLVSLSEAAGGKIAYIPLKTANRGIGQKEQAKMTRELFRELGLKGVSVTCAKGSMCYWVEVAIPARLEWLYLSQLENNWMDTVDKREQGHKWARGVVEMILARAFPNHDDRSDSTVDYFDEPFRIDMKSPADYGPPKPRKAKVTA